MCIGRGFLWFWPRLPKRESLHGSRGEGCACTDRCGTACPTPVEDEPDPNVVKLNKKRKTSSKAMRQVSQHR
jgi:hypothetical protein